MAWPARAGSTWPCPPPRHCCACARNVRCRPWPGSHPSPLEPTLAEALEQAAALFDAGLGFEVHELLEPHWVRASGEERSALQGLIQIAVGYQHLANGNLMGAQALLQEGSERVRGRRLAGMDLEPFGRAVADTVPRVAEPGADVAPPGFPVRDAR